MKWKNGTVLLKRKLSKSREKIFCSFSTFFFSHGSERVNRIRKVIRSLISSYLQHKSTHRFDDTMPHTVKFETKRKSSTLNV